MPTRTGRSSAERNKRVLLITLALATFVLPIGVHAVDPPDSFPFRGGTPISAADVNEAFQSLFDAVTALEPRSVRYGSASGQAIPIGEYTVVDYSSVSFDNSEGSVTTGAAWAFTAPADGIYRISASVEFAASAWAAEERALLTVFVNDTPHSQLDHHRIQDSTTAEYRPFLAGSDLIQLTMGDSLDVRVFQNSETPSLALVGDTAVNRIAIERIE